MSAAETVMRADCLWPGERFRRNGQVFEAIYVAVTPGLPTVVKARALAAAAGDPAMQFAIDPSELLRMVAI